MSVIFAILVGIAGAWAACVLMPKMAYVLTSPDLYVASALPNGAVTKTSDAVPTGMAKSNLPQKNLDVEWVLTAPALTTAQIPSGKTIKYDILWGDSSDLTASPTVYISAAITQTGSPSSGAPQQSYRFRIPSTAGAWIGFRMTASAAGDASVSSATLQGMF